MTDFFLLIIIFAQSFVIWLLWGGLDYEIKLHRTTAKESLESFGDLQVINRHYYDLLRQTTFHH